MDIVIRSSNTVTIGGRDYKCSIGEGGFSADRKEGDKTTPIGTFPIRSILYRKDRVGDIDSPLPSYPINESDGWCTDITHQEYNTKVILPHGGSYENLWREDHIYDIILVIGFNDSPAVLGKGSAIFMHIARDTYSPTEGCIVVSMKDMLEIISLLDKDSKISIALD